VDRIALAIFVVELMLRHTRATAMLLGRRKAFKRRPQQTDALLVGRCWGDYVPQQASLRNPRAAPMSSGCMRLLRRIGVKQVFEGARTWLAIT
jgi:hypothetical protein